MARWATIETPQGPKLVIRQDDHWVDVSASDPSLPRTLRELLLGGAETQRQALRVAQSRDAVCYPADQVRFLPPVLDPQKIVCVGLNYRDHAAESGTKPPREPVLFSKFNTALTGHGQPIVLPAVSQEVDYEAELVVVIGKSGRYIRRQEAYEYVAGYTIGNDVSARDWQLKKEGRQWLAGKTFDTFAPVGPVVVSADEIPDPHRLPIESRLNGRVMQHSDTGQMIFTIAEIVSYISQVCTLHPGDLIFTGTPAGVGFVRQPPVFLKPGDLVEIAIESLGVLRNPVIAETS
ncbi:MAG: fumarylacetoacetate hydrolase [Gemmataceae bacterium]